MKFRRTALVVGTLGIGSALAVAALPAGATPGQGAHFASASDALDGDQLTASFHELGLGDSQPTEALSADAAINYVCADFAQDPTRDSFELDMKHASEQVTQTFASSTDGQVAGTLELPPVGAPCPAGTVNVGRESITYTNVVLADQTNGVTVLLPDQSYTGQTLP